MGPASPAGRGKGSSIGSAGQPRRGLDTIAQAVPPGPSSIPSAGGAGGSGGASKREPLARQGSQSFESAAFMVPSHNGKPSTATYDMLEFALSLFKLGNIGVDSVRACMRACVRRPDCDDSEGVLLTHGFGPSVYPFDLDTCSARESPVRSSVCPALRQCCGYTSLACAHELNGPM